MLLQTIANLKNPVVILKCDILSEQDIAVSVKKLLSVFSGCVDGPYFKSDFARCSTFLWLTDTCFIGVHNIPRNHQSCTFLA